MHNQPKDLDEMLRRFGPEDPKVIEVLVEQYEQYITRLACAILNDSDEAADVMQETFIRAARKLAQYQPGTNIKAWLYTIAINTSRGSLRKRKSRQNLQGILKDLAGPSQYANTPETNKLQKERKEELWGAVDKLGDKHRIPILLRMVEELSVKEIAQVLNIKEKTVYSRLYDGFRMLKARLNYEIELRPKEGVLKK